MAGSSVFGYAESDSEDEMPPGWEERTTLDGLVYYANHKDRRTTYTDPRLAFAIEDQTPPTTSEPKGSSGPRQKYDASTRALQVLHSIDLTNRTVLITGANTGIGFETARSLALHNAHVVMACRSVRRAECARQKILQEKPSANVDILECDLADLGSVRMCALTFRSRGWPLHILILNAGVFALPFQLTDDTRLEKTFATNHMGHFYLAKLLKKVLFTSAPGRVVIVASESHRFATTGFSPNLATMTSSSADTKLSPNLPTMTSPSADTKFSTNVTSSSADTKFSPNLATMTSSSADTKFSPDFTTMTSLSAERLSPQSSTDYWWLQAYNRSKLCNVWLAREMNRRWYPYRVTANALHPGNMVSSNLPRDSCLLRCLFTLVRPFTKSLQQAAATTVYCAVAPELEGIGGHYFNNCWFCQPHKVAEDGELARKLWEISEQILDRFGFRDIEDLDSVS